MKDVFGVLGAPVVLGGVLGAALADATGLARCEQHRLGVRLELDNVARGLEAHRAEVGAYPSELSEIDGRFEAGSVPLDYWRRPFVYERTEGGFELSSLGPLAAALGSRRGSLGRREPTSEGALEWTLQAG